MSRTGTGHGVSPGWSHRSSGSFADATPGSLPESQLDRLARRFEENVPTGWPVAPSTPAKRGESAPRRGQARLA